MTLHTGYLAVETHAEHPVLVHLVNSEREPDRRQSRFGGRIRYVAKFRDIEAAGMHAHEFLRRSLVDVNNRLYRVDVSTAIAAICAIQLTHREIWRDPELTEAELEKINHITKQHRKRQQRVETLIRIISYIALAMLAANLIAQILYLL
jgi:hypothetical protein